MEHVNSVLLQFAESSKTDLIPEVTNYLIAAGGKRIRPMLTLASAKLCNYQGKHHITLAACVECMHTATLLHDDVVDDSALRRGRETAKFLWGNKTSILVGDFLLGQAFYRMVSADSLDVLRILSEAAKIISEGEVLQLALQRAARIFSFEEYIDVVTAKTAALFAAACEVGAVLESQNSAHAKAMYAFGLNLGIAYQIVDDILDFSSNEEFGKTIGNDFLEGKVTLPIILAAQHASEEEKTLWQKWLQNETNRESHLAPALHVLQKHNALEAAKNHANHYANQAIQALSSFPAAYEKELLENIANFTVSRSF